ncbi:MAG: VOC family protein [Oscillospiraceae bacterium]
MKIEHVALFVENLEQSRDFYMHYFGAKSNEKYTNSTTGFESYFLTFDDGARLELMSLPEIALDYRGAAYIGYAHIAISVGSRKAVDDLTRKFAIEGEIVIACPRVTGDGYYESIVLDCDGNRIEITE